MATRACSAVLGLFGLLLAGGQAECPDGCSGHGNCGLYDQCHCWRGFQGEDCSRRLCPFGKAHVDTPKGDLDGDGEYDEETSLIGSIVWPMGTQEKYPNFTDSRGGEVPNMAHDYRECSNKGMCNFQSGLCECFPGYDGTACQRASCPDDCSGHGTCRTIKDLAYYESETTYALWDAEVSMGCHCDPGYGGSNCADHLCPKGLDPLYVDSEITARVESTAYKHTTTSAGGLYGTYALKFYDVFDDDFKTKPIKVDATCRDVMDALEALPNTIIARNSVACSSELTYTNDMTLKESEYALTFSGNPGYMKQLVVDTYLDGYRTTILSNDQNDETNSPNGVQKTYTWTTGMAGEDIDYFSHCRGVELTLGGSLSTETSLDTAGQYFVNEMNSGFYLDSLSAAEVKALKICMGDADGITSNNIEVYNWDYGSVTDGTDYRMDGSPHAIKLVKKRPNDNFDGGMYYLVWWAGTTAGKFVVANAPKSTVDLDEVYYVFTTDGYVERVIIDRDFDSDLDYNEPVVTSWFYPYTNVVYTAVDTSCLNDALRVDPCIEQGDMVFMINSAFLTAPMDSSDVTVTTPVQSKYETGNLFQVTRVYTAPPTLTTFQLEDRFRIVLDKNIGWDGTNTTSAFGWPLFNSSNVGLASVFKFTPATTGNYEFVDSCSNRGTCDTEYGECHCYNGYTAVDCSSQDALAVAH